MIVLSAMKYHVPPEQWYGFYHPMWMAISLLNSLFSFAWDVRNDWDLVQPSARHPLLRNELLYTPHGRGGVLLYYWCEPLLLSSAKLIERCATVWTTKQLNKRYEGEFKLLRHNTVWKPSPVQASLRLASSLPTPLLRASPTRAKAVLVFFITHAFKSLIIFRELKRRRCMCGWVVVGDGRALLSNFMLRIAWTYKLSSHLRHNQMMSTAVAVLEMLRRTQWIFLRVEKQYLSLVKQHRLTITYH